ncbi:MAG: leucine-rich repeat protein [Patescibacteria group bacterium]
MKKVLHALVAVSVLVLLLVSCDKEPEFIPEIVLSQTEFNLPDNATVIEVEVKANVEFGVIVSGKWITRNTTKDLSSTKLFFNIAKNESYGKREDYILIKQKNGELTIPIHVVQSQKDAVVFSNKKVEITPESQVLEVALRANIEFEVIIPDVAQSWVSLSGTKALRDETLLLNIAENTSEEIRMTEVYVKNKAASLQDTLNITQFGKGTNFIFVKQMGTLGTILNQTQKDTITRMIVKGEINAADFEVMKLQMPNLLYLDLGEVICEKDEIPRSAMGNQFNNRDAHKNITTIILPKNIKWIAYRAFDSCTGLTGYLKLPDLVHSIGTDAFANCSFTGSLDLPDKLKIIEWGAFSFNGFTGPLILPKGLVKIGINAFWGCEGFTGDLKIPDTITEIGGHAFSGCSGFNGSLHLPEGLTTIFAHGFSGTGFTGPLNLPKELTTIGFGAFSGCSGFTGDLTIPDKITIIEEYTFRGCSGFIGSLNLPDKLTTIKYMAFSDCEGFTGSLNLPESLTTIERDAFFYCTGFTGSLNLPNGLTTLGEYAFYNCSGFNGSLKLPDGLTTIGEATFWNCEGFTGSLDLPSGLTGIEGYAFTHCIGFTGDLTIPDKVTTIGEYVFWECSGFNGSLNLPDGLTTIGELAFYGCTGFTGTLNLPAGLTTIGKEAFENCAGFTELVISTNLTSIEEAAFKSCSNISGKVIFPISLSHIGKQGFYGCNKVEAFRFPHATPIPYTKDMLPGGATVEVPTTAVDTYKVTDGWKSHNVVGY